MSITLGMTASIRGWCKKRGGFWFLLRHLDCFVLDDSLGYNDFLTQGLMYHLTVLDFPNESNEGVNAREYCSRFLSYKKILSVSFIQRYGYWTILKRYARITNQIFYFLVFINSNHTWDFNSSFDIFRAWEKIMYMLCYLQATSSFICYFDS